MLQQRVQGQRRLITQCICSRLHVQPGFSPQTCALMSNRLPTMSLSHPFLPPLIRIILVEESLVFASLSLDAAGIPSACSSLGYKEFVPAGVIDAPVASRRALEWLMLTNCSHFPSTLVNFKSNLYLKYHLTRNLLNNSVQHVLTSYTCLIQLDSSARTESRKWGSK